MTPTINVNLKPCTCPAGYPTRSGEHHGICKAVPILVPCSLPPKVEFTVRLGECDCAYRNGHRLNPNDHLIDCPARPIRVSCSVWGNTWAESTLVDLRFDPIPTDCGRTAALTLSACRDLWGAVKGLVLGQRAFMTSDVVRALEAQRDAEFAALTKLVQAEQAAIAAQAECDAAFPIDNYVKVPAPDHRSEPRPSTVRLAAFVAHLIATVGDLP